MSVRNNIEGVNGLYYITFTNYKWLHLFHRLNMYDEVYKWFNILEQKNETVTGYVIMPNHLHILMYHREENGSINKIISNAKRFMTYEMVERLKQKNDFATLDLLSDGLSEREKKKGQLHRGFEESFDCKRCYTEKFIQQKLNYMHNNPIQPKWNLCENAIDYEHSSAAFYSECNKKYKFNLRHYRAIQWEVEDSSITSTQTQ